jgi:hypothetical protein
LCRSSATSIASGIVSHNRVDPSISVSKNVTVPAGNPTPAGSPSPAGDAPVPTAAPACSGSPMSHSFSPPNSAVEPGDNTHS